MHVQAYCDGNLVRIDVLPNYRSLVTTIELKGLRHILAQALFENIPSGLLALLGSELNSYRSEFPPVASLSLK